MMARMLQRLQRTWKSVKTDYKDCKYWYGYSCYYDNSKPSWIGFHWEFIKGQISRIVCHFKGHDWIEEGEAGPDSGWIGATCQRCDKSFRKTLY